jgi:hypothetical protein
MEPESSLPYSQVSATCPYPEPAPSSPHNPLPLPEDPSLSLIATIFILALNNINIDVKEIRWKFVNWIRLANDIAPVNTAVILGFQNWHKFSELSKDY